MKLSCFRIKRFKNGLSLLSGRSCLKKKLWKFEINSKFKQLILKARAYYQRILRSSILFLGTQSEHDSMEGHGGRGGSPIHSQAWLRSPECLSVLASTNDSDSPLASAVD